jgi:cysteine-rich repeat protein
MSSHNFKHFYVSKLTTILDYYGFDCPNLNVNFPETWDDGNYFVGDGWDDGCQIEIGFDCIDQGSGLGSFCSSIWGDRLVIDTESCDDGNTVNGDGCSSICGVEEGWECQNFEGSASIWTEKTGSVEAATSQAIAGAAMAGSAAASSMSFSSPSGLWQAMNMMQLFALLLMFGVYLPIKIKDFISSSSLFSLSFDLSFMKEIPWIGPHFTYLNFSQDNLILKNSGANSGNTLVNILFQLLLLTVTIFLHLCSIPLRKCDPIAGKGRASKCFRNLGKWIWNLFTFTIYVRLWMQSSQYLSLISISGLYYSNLNDFPHILSLGFSIFTSIALVSFLLFGVYKWYKFVGRENIRESNFNEFFSGLKKKRFASAYNLLLVLIRLIMISWLIWWKSLPLVVFIPSMWIYQLLHTTFVIVFRPSSHPKENFVEISNEVIFTLLVWGMWYLTEESKWNIVITNAYLYLMMFPGILIFVVSFCKLNSNTIYNNFSL